MGHDLLAILAHNEIPYVMVESEVCCGMPKLELGDLQGVEALKTKNIPVLARYAREGYAILAPVPSCALMFKQELPLMYPDDADTIAVRDAMFDPFEYFVLRKKDGLLKTDFKQVLGKVSYHIPCHSRVQNMGQKTREMLESIPGTEVTTVERCSGHDGTWGVKTEYFDNSMKIGRPVFRQMAQSLPACFCELGLPDRRAPHHAGHGRSRPQARRQGPPAFSAAQGLRYLRAENRVCP